VRRTAITLHVGPGTFKPVKTELVEDHRMEEERYTVPPAAARMIRQTRLAGGRIVAVGSTVVRTLETAAAANGSVAPGSGRSAIFIVPPYSFKIVDAMLTNFHLPRSTLLMMVSAFAGMELTRRAYETAVKESYRFYSYGDCMLIS
jgi:S-adenosylmethionine:tRNA ribosyltransferase-isomerase